MNIKQWLKAIFVASYFYAKYIYICICKSQLMELLSSFIKLYWCAFLKGYALLGLIWITECLMYLRKICVVLKRYACSTLTAWIVLNSLKFIETGKDGWSVFIGTRPAQDRIKCGCTTGKVILEDVNIIGYLISSRFGFN